MGIPDSGCIPQLYFSKHQQQHGGDQHVHHGSRERYGELLRWPVWHASHARDPTDRQQGHFRRLYAEMAGGEDMPELVQHNAGEEQHDEGEAVARTRRPMLQPGAEPYPEQKQEKGEVDLDGGPANFPYRQRPVHRASSDPVRGLDSRYPPYPCIALAIADLDQY